MAMDSAANSFVDRLKERMEQERKEIENLTQAELQSLSVRLRELSSTVLQGIASDMERQYRQEVQEPLLEGIRLEMEKALKETGEQTRALQAVTSEMETQINRIGKVSRSTWTGILLVGMGTLAMSGVISWGTMRWLSGEIQMLRTEREELKKRIADQERTLADLDNQLWGVTLRENEKGRFVVLPLGARSDPNWKIDGRPAVLFWREQNPVPPGKRRR